MKHLQVINHALYSRRHGQLERVRLWLRIILSLLATASLSINVAAQNVDLRARLDSAAMLIGDPNRVVVDIPAQLEDAVVDWTVLDTIEALVQLGEVSATQNGELRQFAFPFSVYDSVGLLFPSLPVYATGETLYTNDLALLVDFLPVDSTLNAYRPLREEPARFSDYKAWIIALAVGLLVLGLLAYFLLRAKPKEVVAPPPVIVEAPHAVALRDLDALRNTEDLSDKIYYSELDRILRTYVEGRYDVPALERTSSEVVALLRDKNLLPDEGLGALLSEVDLIKFAKAKLPLERRQLALNRVQTFINSSRLRESTLTDQTINTTATPS